MLGQKHDSLTFSLCASGYFGHWTIFSHLVSEIQNDMQELRRRPANCEMRGLVLCAHRHFSDVPGSDGYDDAQPKLASDKHSLAFIA